MNLFQTDTPRKFIMVTQDFTGFGFAKKLMDEGSSVVVAYEFVEGEGAEIPGKGLLGRGMLNRVDLESVWKVRKKFKDAYWFFDSNSKHSPLGDQLRSEGFPRVFGGRQLTMDMEFDREFGVELVNRAGLKSPDTFEFADAISGIQYLEANPEKAYVFKPNSTKNGWETFVPDSEKDPIANEELLSYLESLPTGNSDGYILQERIQGVEVNFEGWLHNGKMYAAFCELECKKKNNDDLGGLVGGAQDICFPIPIDCKGIRETITKIAALPEFKDYTGFLDANVIIADNGPYFLEFCARFGYPMHVSLFYQLPKVPFSDIFAQMMDGNDLDSFVENNFKYGFAAGITLNCEKERKGLPVYIPDDLESKFFPYDIFKRGEKLLTVGYDMEVGVMTAHGFTIPDAAELAVERAKKVAFPNRGMRTDLAKDDYPSNPRDRYLALEAMRYLVP